MFDIKEYLKQFSKKELDDFAKRLRKEVEESLGYDTEGLKYRKSDKEWKSAYDEEPIPSKGE